MRIFFSLRHLTYIRKCRRMEVTHYHLRNPYHFAIPGINSVYRGSEIISNLRLRIWNIVSNRLSFFKKELKDGSLKSVRVSYLGSI